MGSKGMEKAYGFSLDVINEVRRAIDESGLKDFEVFKAAEMSRDYFYKRMSGEKPFNTNDLTKISGVLGLDAFFILRRAAARADRREVASVASQLDAVLAKKKMQQIDFEKAAYVDENKKAESGRGEDVE